MVYARSKTREEKRKWTPVSDSTTLSAQKAPGCRTLAEVFYGDTVPRNAASTARRCLMYRIVLVTDNLNTHHPSLVILGIRACRRYGRD